MQILMGNTLLGNRKATAFLLLIGLFSLLFATESVRIALATRIGESKNIVQIRRAVELDPENPELHFRLGSAETYNLDSPDPAEGIRQLQRATELSPYRARYWRALASACQLEGDKACAGHAISRSLALSPMTPRVHWEAANYYLWANDEARALGQFQRLLELDASYAGQVFRTCLGVTGSPEMVYQRVLPPAASPDIELSYVNFLASHGHEDFALHVWKEVVAGRAPFKFALADPYLEHLIGAQEYQQALSVWGDLETRGLVPSSADNGGLVFNGGFEHVPLNAGFDWRYEQNPYVAIDFKSDQPGEGKHWLQLDFRDVENHQDQPVYQLVPVSADQTYVLAAQVRSANLTSGSGPRLRVLDPACPQCLNVSSDAVVGTTPWHQISLRFRTGPQTSAVRVSIWRARSLDYPTEILGTLWVDQVSLRPATFASPQATQRQGTS